MSDNGPHFTSQNYTEFAKDYHFEHVTSSPYFAQSNGEAERAVATIEGLLKKERDPYMALLTYRVTPLQIGYSPAELLMNRKLRTTVPISREQRAPVVPDTSTLREKDEQLKAREKRNFDQRHRVRDCQL